MTTRSSSETAIQNALSMQTDEGGYIEESEGGYIEESDGEDYGSEEGEQRVESLLRMATMRGAGITARRVLVKWRSLAYEESTWEPRKNLHPEALRDFEWKRQLPFTLSELLMLPPHAPIEVLEQQRLLPVPTHAVSDSESESGSDADEDGKAADGEESKGEARLADQGETSSAEPRRRSGEAGPSALAQGVPARRERKAPNRLVGTDWAMQSSGAPAAADQAAKVDAAAEEDAAAMDEEAVDEEEWQIEGHELVGQRVAHVYVGKRKGEEQVMLGRITKWVPADEEEVRARARVSRKGRVPSIASMPLQRTRPHAATALPLLPSRSAATALPLLPSRSVVTAPAHCPHAIPARPILASPGRRGIIPHGARRRR